MRRFISNFLAKSLTGKSTDDRNQENFTNFCLEHRISNTNTKKYRIDRDPMNPQFWEVTYIGICSINDKQSGLIVSVSEYTGFTQGALFSVNENELRDDAVKEYKKNNDGYPDFYNYWQAKICSERTVLANSADYKHQ